MFRKMLIFLYRNLSYFAMRFIYGPWSRFYRWAFERKYKDLPLGLPWTTKQVMDFFRTCTWTKDKWYMGFDVISKPQKFFETRRGDCVSLDTEIIVKNQDGLLCIKTMAELRDTYTDYLALTYNFTKQRYEWQPITQWVDKGIRPVYESKFSNGSIIKCTQDHELFTWRRSKNHLQVLPLKEIPLSKEGKNKTVCIAKQIPSIDNNSYLLYQDRQKQKAEMWLYGIYLAEGWAEAGHVCIANDDPDIVAKIIASCNLLGVEYGVSKRKTHGYVSIHKSALKERLKEFGSNSFNKHIPYPLFSCDLELLEVLNNAYRAGDAWKPRDGRKSHPDCELIHNTSSDQLCKDLKVLYLLLGRPLAPYHQKDHQGVGNSPIWRLYESSGKQYLDKMPGMASKGLRYRKDIGDLEVCDITVANTHNFILSNGIVAHNCDEYAVFAAEVLPRKRTRWLLSVTWYNPTKGRPTFSGHNVCLYPRFKQIDGRTKIQWWHLSNWGKIGPFSSIFALIDSIPPDGAIGCAWSLRPPRAKMRDEKDLSFKFGGKFKKGTSKKQGLSI